MRFVIGIPEARYSEEFALLFERAGARVRRCPLQKEMLLEDQSSILSFVDRTISDGFDVCVFMTGIGVNLILQQADRAAKRNELLKALDRLTVVSRGSKSTAALRKANVRIDVIPAAATSEGVIESLLTHDLRGKSVAVQLYGTPNPVLCSALESFGASVFPISVYSYEAASDAREVESFVRDIIGGGIHIVVFTSAPQVHALFDAATSLQLDEALRERFARSVRVASIGEVTTRALTTYDVRPHIVPDQPKMGAMVKAICTTPSL